MNRVNPERNAVKELFQLPETKPIYMLNMLRFKEKAEDGKTGKEKYSEYQKAAAPLLKQNKAEIIWSGSFAKNLLNDKKWDLIYLVKYPSPRSFLQLITSKEYQDILPIRENALEEAEMIANYKNE